MIFVNSMSDLFHPDVPFGFVDHIINASYRAPQHTYLILTKRPERMQLYFESCAERGIPAALWMRHGLRLWLGVTAENQEQAEKRIPTLLQVPAALRFVSVEPMLSAVDLTSITIRQRINWVICGGESGPGARPMHPDWVRSLRDQCQDAGVPFFLKSWGEWEPSETVPWKDTAYHRVSDGSIASYLLGVKKHWWGGNDGDGKPLSVRVGKKAAGHLLDGLEWREMPHQM
jgi:protein gp37